LKVQAGIKAQNCGVHCKANQINHVEQKNFTNIPKGLYKHSKRTLQTFQKNFTNIPKELYKHSKRTLQTFQKNFTNIPKRLFELRII